MSGKTIYELSAHAARVLAEREIPVAWVERMLSMPQRMELDAVDPVLRLALGRIAERDDRVLRVGRLLVRDQDLHRLAVSASIAFMSNRSAALV